jgi:hypothetical protein
LLTFFLPFTAHTAPQKATLPDAGKIEKKLLIVTPEPKSINVSANVENTTTQKITTTTVNDDDDYAEPDTDDGIKLECITALCIG